MRGYLGVLITVMTTVFVQGNNECRNCKNLEYASLCQDLNLTISFANLQLSRLDNNFLSSPLIKCLDLSRNSINYVSMNAFDNLPNLEYLDLSDNSFGISTILDSSLLNLEILILDRIGNGYILDMKGFYPKLRKLSLENTNIIKISANSKHNFPSLTHLYLAKNEITYDNFDWLPDTLEYIDITGHYLTSLTLKDLSNLKCLEIDNMYEKKLSVIKLQNLPKLEHLSVTRNNINQISATTFVNVTSLKYLDMSDNNMKYIEAGSFESVPNLQYLNLSSNEIEVVEPGLFNVLHDLKSLMLGKNALVTFPTLTTEIKLENLWLNSNKIKNLVGRTFVKMPYLQHLYLHDNEIAYLDAQAFVGLSKLKVLTLSCNQLFSLPTNWLMPMKNLLELDLAGNNITDIENLSLSDTSSLQNLYLSIQLRYLRSKALYTIPENITINMDPNFQYTELCNKEKDKYSRNNYK